MITTATRENAINNTFFDLKQLKFFPGTFVSVILICKYL